MDRPYQSRRPISLVYGEHRKVVPAIWIMGGIGGPEVGSEQRAKAASVSSSATPDPQTRSTSSRTRRKYAFSRFAPNVNTGKEAKEATTSARWASCDAHAALPNWSSAWLSNGRRSKPARKPVDRKSTALRQDSTSAPSAINRNGCAGNDGTTRELVMQGYRAVRYQEFEARRPLNRDQHTPKCFRLSSRD
jgi:hypothetical protein